MEFRPGQKTFITVHCIPFCAASIFFTPPHANSILCIRESFFWVARAIFGSPVGYWNIVFGGQCHFLVARSKSHLAKVVAIIFCQLAKLWFSKKSHLQDAGLPCDWYWSLEREYLFHAGILHTVWIQVSNIEIYIFHLYSISMSLWPVWIPDWWHDCQF